MAQVALEAFHEDGSDRRRLATIGQAELARGLAATPMDHFVIWDGCGYDARAGSRCSRVLGLVTEVWTPVSLRELVLRGARAAGFRPEDVRSAVRAHQAARGACYLLVRRTALGEYVSVTDVPFPAAQAKSLRPGELVMTRAGARAV